MQLTLFPLTTIRTLIHLSTSTAIALLLLSPASLDFDFVVLRARLVATTRTTRNDVHVLLELLEQLADDGKCRTDDEDVEGGTDGLAPKSKQDLLDGLGDEGHERVDRVQELDAHHDGVLVLPSWQHDAQQHRDVGEVGREGGHCD